MVSRVVRLNGCIFLMDEAERTRIAAQQKKQVILPEIVTLEGGKRAINFGLRDRGGGEPPGQTKIRLEALWRDWLMRALECGHDHGQRRERVGLLKEVTLNAWERAWRESRPPQEAPLSQAARRIPARSHSSCRP